MGYLGWVYLVYGAVSLGVTIWLARTLSRSGGVFLEDVFGDQPALAAAVNRLLVVGFTMFNAGYAFLLLGGRPAAGPVEAVEVLAHKLGLLLMSLAALHFINLAIFQKIRHRARVTAGQDQR